MERPACRAMVSIKSAGSLALTICKAHNTPYEEIRIINLMHDRAGDGRVLEIERALEPGTYGIKPSEYMPLATRI